VMEGSWEEGGLWGLERPRPPWVLLHRISWWLVSPLLIPLFTCSTNMEILKYARSWYSQQKRNSDSTLQVCLLNNESLLMSQCMLLAYH
jgi:hypothetical protein